MPDNDLERRLAVIESEFGLTRPQQTDVRASHTDNINWKALYKVLESEVYPAGLVQRAVNPPFFYVRYTTYQAAATSSSRQRITYTKQHLGT